MLSIIFQSFSYKKGLPSDADVIFDMRHLPNPYWDPALRAYTGCDAIIQTFLSEKPEVIEIQHAIDVLLSSMILILETSDRNTLHIAIGCTGGIHRSVYMVEFFVQLYHQKYPMHHIQHHHRELGTAL